MKLMVAQVIDKRGNVSYHILEGWQAFHRFKRKIEEQNFRGVIYIFETKLMQIIDRQERR